MWALTISVHTQPPLPLGHVDGFKASNFIHKHTTEMVPGLQLILWVCDHVLALARQWTWFVLSHNGTSAYCDQLTPPAVRILSLEPTSLVWKNTSVYVCACVCVCVCTPPCLEYSVYVCILAGLYYCSLGKATFFVRKKKKKNNNTQNKPGDDPSFVPLHSHKVSVMSFLCHSHLTMQHPNSFFCPGFFSEQRMYDERTAECTMCPLC